MKIAILFNQFGPYHYARLNAAGKMFQTYGIEMFSKSSDYKWEVSGFDQDVHFIKRTLFYNNTTKQVSKTEQKQAVFNVLDEISPDAVAVNGWSEIGALAALKWCLRNKVPAIAMSDSTQFDVTRTKIKEAIKKRIVASFSSALVAGRPQKTYIQKLGMPEPNIFLKYDVVDNKYFSEKSITARKDKDSYRNKFHLPEKYFLASARFIEKKNLTRLLKAFAIYKEKAGNSPWQLVLVGDGEMRAQLESLTKVLNIEKDILMPGFIQYDEIPYYYSLASVFIHCSTSEQWGLVVNEAMACGLPVLLSNRCGCALDLVKEKENGFLFDPFDINDMATKMLAISSGSFDLEQMSKNSLEIIRSFLPEDFAINLKEAALKAISVKSRDNSIINSLTLDLLVQ